MVSDYGLMGLAMIRMGEPLAWVYVILMWVTVGNGLRFGNRYLYLGVLGAVASFGSTLIFNDYWHAQPQPRPRPAARADRGAAVPVRACCAR